MTRRPVGALGALLLEMALLPSCIMASTSLRRLVPNVAFPSARDGFEPILADNMELGYGGRYILSLGQDRYGEVAIGDYVGLARWGLGGDAILQANLGGGMLGRFNLSTKRNNLEVADYTAAFPVDIRFNPQHAVQLGWRHTSSHLGDDFIARTKAVVEKRSHDMVRTLYAWTPDEKWRFYGGGALAVNTDNVPGRGSMQTGMEWVGPYFWNRRTQWFLAQDLQFWERIEWNPIYTIRAGLRIADQKRIAAARMFVEYFTGRLYFLQFNGRHESRWSFGLNFEVGNPTR